MVCIATVRIRVNGAYISMRTICLTVIPIRTSTTRVTVIHENVV